MSFEEAYQTLNTEQKKAVDTVEGPVLVIAGPGTGKTHILTLRIANILKLTQANPSQILALTFTVSAARTMRMRLASIVGESVARQVMITTFHGFCEYVLDTYSDAFGTFSERRLLRDVEQVLLWREVFDEARVRELRPPKKPYTYLTDVSRIYDTLSREGVTTEEYRAWGREQRQSLENDPSLQYVRGTHKGELKKEGIAKVKRFDKVDETATLIDAYQEKKEEQGVYDFGDLLRVVIDTIATDEGLRATLQETYQYILADEHQDTNALQHQLLELFAYDDYPNIFLVGDEKQAIYRFQGGDISAMRSFVEMFPRAAVIELSQSFRSKQPILDTAHVVMQDTGVHVALTSVRDETVPEPSVFRIDAEDPLDERDRVAAQVDARIQEGTAPHEIAIITRKNETADVFARHLEARGIPALRAGDVTLTSRPLIRYILALMAYVADPTDTGAYRLTLLAPWWAADIADRLVLLRTTTDSDIEKRVRDTYPEIHTCIEKLVVASTTATPIECFSLLLSTSGARAYILSHAEHIDDISLIRLLMMHLEEVGGRVRTFGEAFAMIKRAHEHGMTFIKQSLTQQEGLVSVITAHKAKGMEFEHVFVPEVTEQTWERGGRAPTIPSPFLDSGTLDDARRLFYVALTRAKDCAYVSYARTSKDGRERNPSVLMPSGAIAIEGVANPLPVLHEVVEAPALFKRMAEMYLAHDGLSPTALNEYLVAPPRFFARRVLRMHEPPEGALVVGTAVHTGIAALLEKRSIKEAHAALEKAFTRSLLLRDNIFKDLLEDAHASLDTYHDSDLALGEPQLVEKTFEITREIDNTSVILKGKIDAVFLCDGVLKLVDFKTGSSVRGTDEGYVRQVVLYVELLRANGHDVKEASLVAVTPKGVREYPVAITKEATAEAYEAVDATVRELLTGKWRKGESSEYDALLEI